MITAADDHPVAGLTWTFVILSALLVHSWLVIATSGDLFRRPDISGWGTAGGIAVMVLPPLIGWLTYVITRGRAVADRDVRQAQRVRQQTDDHVASVASPGTRDVDEIARVEELLAGGPIGQEEFEQLERRLLV